MKTVRITKLNDANNAEYPSIPMEQFIPGQDNGNVSMPVNYWLEGILVEDIKVDHSVVVNRTSRMGVKCAGYFVSSPVVELTDTGFVTHNSVYRVEYIDDEHKTA